MHRLGLCELVCLTMRSLGCINERFQAQSKATRHGQSTFHAIFVEAIAPVGTAKTHTVATVDFVKTALSIDRLMRENRMLKLETLQYLALADVRTGD